jgi:thiol-disulfide isomerase/thioredoxin
MSKYFFYLASILSIYTLLSNISGINALEIQDINDGNINSIVGDGKGKFWLLMFYLETCPYCQVAKESLENLSQKYELHSGDTFENFNIGKIECSVNNWSCMRFGVSRVPFIVLLKDDKLFEFKTHATESNLFDFISEEKTVESGKPIPEPMGIFIIVSKILKESLNVINEQITKFVNEKLNISIEWNTNYTIGVLILSLIFIILVEYYIVYYCCSFNIPHSLKKVEKKQEEKKEETEKANEEADDKKEKKE